MARASRVLYFFLSKNSCSILACGQNRSLPEQMVGIVSSWCEKPAA